MHFNHKFRKPGQYPCTCRVDLHLFLLLSFSVLFWRYKFLWPFSNSTLLFLFGVGLPAYCSNHSPLSREHIFVGFNEFPSLVYWCTVIHHHRPTLFRRVRWDLHVCSVVYRRGSQGKWVGLVIQSLHSGQRFNSHSGHLFCCNSLW